MENNMRAYSLSSCSAGLFLLIFGGAAQAQPTTALLATKVICNQDGSWEFHVSKPVNADINLYIASTRAGSDASQWMTGTLTKGGENVRDIAPDHGNISNSADLQEYMPVMQQRLTQGDYAITLHGTGKNSTFKRLGVNVSVHGTTVPSEVFRGAATSQCVTP
jgi:hypothetical protein